MVVKGVFVVEQLHPDALKIKNKVILHFGSYYARHLIKISKNSQFLDCVAIRRSVDNYFKAKDDLYWAELYSFCLGLNTRWTFHDILSRLARVFDKTLGDKLNEPRFVGNAFLSAKTLAENLGKPFSDTSTEAKWAAYEERLRCRKESVPPTTETTGSSDSDTCRRFSKLDYSFWDDWDYH